MSEKRIWELLDILSLREEQDARERKARSLAAIRKTLEQADIKTAPSWYALSGRRRLFAIAAVILLLFSSLTLLLHRRRGALAEAGAFNMIDTRAGSKTYITLPDSSIVILNGVCKFGYNKEFGVTKREMILKGEAYFDIRKNSDVPLTIAAGNVNIRVLGTSFNVKAYSEDAFVEATLIKGAIEVSLKTDPGRAILLRPGEKIVIRQHDSIALTGPGKVAEASHRNMNEVIAVSKVEADPRDSTFVETAWLKDKMVFRKESFESLARRMERWYNVHIVFTDPGLGNLVFTGSFEKEDIRQALQALQNSASFNYNIDDKTVKISSH